MVYLSTEIAYKSLRMHMKHILTSFTLCVSLLLALACNGSKECETKRSMYYWQTTFNIDSTKADFIRKHGIQQLYVRYFDVIHQGANVPDATILMDSAVECPVPIVPVVYIMNDCMRHPDYNLAEKLAKRILQMSETHHVPVIREVQVDCDWTKSTRESFFRFLEELRDTLHNRDIQLSVTIRLHQLSQPAPPADRGILMVYNTGDLTHIDVEKPILDINDVKPYLRYLGNYGLPLVTALPIYRWNLVFRNGHFVDFMHTSNDVALLEGDTIVVREPKLQDLLETKQAIQTTRPDCLNEIILFDLNNYNINRFTTNEYEKIYR